MAAASSPAPRPSPRFWQPGRLFHLRSRCAFTGTRSLRAFLSARVL